MSFRHLASTGILTVGAAGVWLAVASGAGAQTRAKATAAAPVWTPPRTPWGDPDLEGVWTNSTTTPLERPDKFAGKDSLTDEERTSLDAEAARNSDRPAGQG